MRIGYLTPEVGDAAVARRLRMLRLGGAEVRLAGFARDRSGTPDEPGLTLLGVTRNHRLAERVFTVLRTLAALAFRPIFGDRDVLIARNLEMLVIAVAIASRSAWRPTIVYECLDIHRLMLGDGPAGRMLRALERLLLRSVAAVITSSPSFEKRYFRDRQSWDGEMILVENKLMPDGAFTRLDELASPAVAPWRIGWFGVLRCRRSLVTLVEVAEALGDRVEIILRGQPDYDLIPDFDALVAAAPRIVFHGRYRYPDDLAGMYGEVHFAWAIDFYEEGQNSAWLLPNRLYEGGAYGAPPIAIEGVAVTDWLATHDVGVIVGEPLSESVRTFLEGVNADAYAQLRARMAALPTSAFVWRDEDSRELVRRLAAAGKPSATEPHAAPDGAAKTVI